MGANQILLTNTENELFTLIEIKKCSNLEHISKRVIS
jgi:hypothetical protein